MTEEGCAGSGHEVRLLSATGSRQILGRSLADELPRASDPPTAETSLARERARLRGQARVRGGRHVRLHDLRHSFASVGAGLGESLLLIGSLLGHKTPATTARYAHLSDDPQKASADRISGRIAAAMRNESGKVVNLNTARN